MRNISACSDGEKKQLIVLETKKNDFFFQISTEKYADYGFEELDHNKERECILFSSLAITEHTKLQLR